MSVRGTEEKDTAKRYGLAYCEKENRITEVLFHAANGPNFFHIDETCKLRGYCYPCFKKGFFHLAFHPGRIPPEGYRVKCTTPFHHYLYYVDVTDDDFLKDKLPSAITEEEARFLEKFIPDFEKDEGFNIYP